MFPVVSLNGNEIDDDVVSALCRMSYLNLLNKYRTHLSEKTYSATQRIFLVTVSARIPKLHYLWLHEIKIRTAKNTAGWNTPHA